MTIKSHSLYTPRIHWVARGTGTPKDKDEIHRREVYECDGRVCALEVMCSPLSLRLTRKDTALVRMLSSLDLKLRGER